MIEGSGSDPYLWLTEARKHTDPTDPDPQHGCNRSLWYVEVLIVLQGGAEADAEEEERVPAPKGYNLDFLDNLDDPSFNPFQTKTAIKVKVLVELQYTVSKLI